jgi:glycosyltransferase involved in cell wall biosynthesis
MEKQMKLSIIIPVYNEEDSIAKVVEQVLAVDLGNVEKEVIISDDGSQDRTYEIIQALKIKYPGLISYHLPINLGKGAAVRLGIALSSGELITIQDADMELDPNEYPRLITPLLNHETKIVYGSRFLNSKVKLKRTPLLANRLLTILTNLLYGCHLTDMETAYKMFLRETMNDIRLRCVRFDFEPEITANFAKKGYHIVEVPVSYIPRTIQAGKKISWIDGYDAICTLIRCRLFKWG